MELKNLQLIVMLTLIFGVLSISLIFFETSIGFASFQIVRLAISLVALIFVVGIYARSRKRFIGNSTKTSSGATKPEENYASETELSTKTTKEKSPYWLIFVICAIFEFIAGGAIFGITESRAYNWAFLIPFVIGGCVLLALAGWSWKRK
jgi:hypothetical protein